MDFNPQEYRSIGAIVTDMAEILRPSKRMTVADSATAYRHLNNPGSYVGRWKHEMTPYMVEPMQRLTDRSVEAVIFAGPAQAAKTELSLNWVTHSVVSDPMDMIIYEKSQVAARDFSKRRVDRLHRHSPEVGSRLMPRADADNTFDKYYKNGMILTLSWPSIAELSGRPVGRVALSDYDRMPEDIDGEGSAFDLARKRTTTFGTSAKTLAESSPGYEVIDPKWMRRTPHEAPPTKGILALYNRGDRRRWYWHCKHCMEWFEPEFSLLKWIEHEDILNAAETVHMMCPHCQTLIPPSEKMQHNIEGVWIPEGIKLRQNGEWEGTALRSDIASYWLKGPAATFAPWKALVSRYLMAEREFLRTGSQEALKATVNTDQGEAYYPRGSERERLPDELKADAVEMPKQIVPEGVRFLVATADVQKNMWVVQVHGVSPGKPFSLTVVDRFSIVKSQRYDDDGERLWVKPAAFLEDWDLLVSEVIKKRYEMWNGGSMGVAFFGTDSGGREGVTEKAYDWYRKLRRTGSGEHLMSHLIKGDPFPGAPRTRISYPDSGRKDRKAAARGEIPVLLLNVNILKDQLQNMLERNDEDNPAICYPAWLPDEWFNEMCAERRTAKGWENPRKARNEAWDLLTYCIGICLHRKVDRINWDAAQGFASPPETNPFVKMPTIKTDSSVAKNQNGIYPSVKDLASVLA